jgi:hypothetical protein
MAEKILWQVFDVDAELAIMKLDRAGLTEAVRFAEHHRSFVTANDPVGFANYVVYAKAGRALREIYLPQGWVKDDSNNQTAIKNPKTMIRVVPCNFDEYAGNRLVRPANKSPKGEVSRAKSACNRTAWLPGLPDIRPEANDGYRTWILGIHADDQQATGAELSFPVAFDGSFFTQFGTRLILLSGGDDPEPRVSVMTSHDAVEIVDIAVKRK